MHVIRRIGATPTIVQSSATKTPFNAPGYRSAYVPGDVQEVVHVSPPPGSGTSTPSTSTTPTGTPNYDSACQDLWGSLLAQAPGYVQSCIATPKHHDAFNQICRRIASGQMTMQAGAAQWAGYVQQVCPPPRTNVPPQTTVPPATIVPPNTPVTPPTNVPPPLRTPSTPTAPPMDTPSGGGPSEDVSAEPSHLRQVGSIVGIGLILAVGLTYARKKGMLRLTRRRGRR